MVVKQDGPAAAPKPEEPLLKIAGLDEELKSIVGGPATALEIEDYKPSIEDLARASVKDANPDNLPQSISAQTLAEMEAGRQALERRNRIILR